MTDQQSSHKVKHSLESKIDLVLVLTNISHSPLVNEEDLYMIPPPSREHNTRNAFGMV